MLEYFKQGVYIEEFEIGARPIDGVSKNTARFLGLTIEGHEKPRLVTGFEEFERIYCSYLPNSSLAYGVEGSFNNGGQCCFVGRIVHHLESIKKDHGRNRKNNQ